MVSPKKLIDTMVELKDTSWQYRVASNPLYMTLITVLVIMLFIILFYSAGIFRLTFYISVFIFIIFMIHNHIIINEVKSEKIEEGLMNLFDGGEDITITGQRERVSPSYITGGPPASGANTAASQMQMYYSQPIMGGAPPMNHQQPMMATSYVPNPVLIPQSAGGTPYPTAAERYPPAAGVPSGNYDMGDMI